MLLKNILQGIKYPAEIKNIEITNISNNSKTIKPGGLFVAIKGYDFDGNEYIKEAIQNGAVVIVMECRGGCQQPPYYEQPHGNLCATGHLWAGAPTNTQFIAVQNVRYALGIISRNFYGNPGESFKLIGITGTKGKTTTSFMIKNILEQAGFKVRVNRNNRKIYRK